MRTPTEFLFDLPPLINSEKAIAIIGLKCRHCKNAQGYQCGSKVFYYCEVIKSNRTLNGLLKIKLKDEACIKFNLKT